MDKIDPRQIYHTVNPHGDNGFMSQCNAAVERLIINHYSLVNRWTSTVETKDELNVHETIESLVKVMTEVASAVPITNIEDDRPEYAFIGEDVFIHLEPNWQSDWDDTTRRDIPTGSCPSVGISCYYVDVEVITQLKKSFEDVGLTVTGGKSGTGLIPVTFAFPDNGDVDFRRQSIERISLGSIEDNYSAEVVDATRELISRCDEVTHGLVLINGPVGTGKSYLIRAILSEMRQRRAIVCSPPTEFLISAGMISRAATRHRKSLIILEDIGDVIESDSPGRHTDARANLLNLSEGIMSLLMDSIIVITFNYDIARIDPAITRDGRCLAQITTKKLSFMHTKRLLDFVSNGLPDRPYSLAEIYEMRRRGSVNIAEVEQPMGFVKR